MKVILLGKGLMLANLIRGAILANAEIVGVFRYERLYYSSLRLFFEDIISGSPELTLIRKHKLPEIKFNSANCEDFKNFILKTNTDVILVGTWSEKIKKDVYEMPKIATINVHPSLLPKYRGPNPYLQTIWHREKFSGVTFHLMSEKFDAGPILAQDKIEILPVDTGKELREKTVFRARLLCAQLLESLKNNCITPQEQNEAEATYYKDVKPEDMTLDFTKENSSEILAHVRAFHPFRPTYIQVNNSFYTVNPYKVKINNNNDEPAKYKFLSKNSISIACSDGICLKFSDLKRY